MKIDTTGFQRKYCSHPFNICLRNSCIKYDTCGIKGLTIVSKLDPIVLKSCIRLRGGIMSSEQIVGLRWVIISCSCKIDIDSNS